MDIAYKQPVRVGISIPFLFYAGWGKDYGAYMPTAKREEEESTQQQEKAAFFQHYTKSCPTNQGYTSCPPQKQNGKANEP